MGELPNRVSGGSDLSSTCQQQGLVVSLQKGISGRTWEHHSPWRDGPHPDANEALLPVWK